MRVDRVVETKEVNSIKAERFGAESACSNCEGTFLVPRLHKGRIKAELCSCLPKPVKPPKLSPDVETRFKIWMALRDGGDASHLYPPKPVRPFPASELETLKRVKAELDNGRSLSELAKSPRHVQELQKALVKLEQYEKEISESEKARRNLAPTETDAALFENFIAEKAKVEAHIIDAQKRENSLRRKIELVDRADLISDALPEGRESLPKPIQVWLNSLKSDSPKSLFIHGYTGTGKTTLAVFAAYYAIIECEYATSFLTSDDVITARKDASTVSFKSKDSENCRRRWNNFKHCLENEPLLILDDLGSQKPSETTEAAYSEIIGMRYQSRLPTIFTANHWLGDGLNGKSLADKVGHRAADRVLGSLNYLMSGPSKRRAAVAEMTKDPRDVLIHESEFVDMEIARNFQTTGIEEGVTTSPFFVAHNPVFQLVSKKERAAKTGADGRDIALPERRYSDVWNKGDDLSMVGYLLCQNDMMTFHSLLETWHDYHRSGGRGIAFETSISSLRSKLGMSDDSSDTTKRLMRSIYRLAKTKIHYVGHNRETFIGGFVDTVYHKSATSQSKISISINPAFIKFYEKTSFFKLDARIPSSLSYQARLLYIFLESQSEDSLSVPLPKLAKLYGRAESAAKNREFRRSVRDALEELKASGLQGEDAHLGSDGVIATRRIARSSPRLTLPE